MRALSMVAAVALVLAPAHAQPPPPPPPATSATAATPQAYALFRLDPLGIEAEIVDRLERILRVELEGVLGQALPAHAAVEQVAAANPKLAACTANPVCLKPLAKALGATRIIAGNVGGLGDAYVVNLKLVDKEARELRRVTVTLRGAPEELIDEIRIAAYRLVAPERMTGSIAVLSDVPGAMVNLDERDVGTTPLAAPLAGLPVGIHQLSVTREGYTPYAETVPVRFEKTTQVVVRQPAVSPAAQRAEQRRRSGALPVYTRWWFWTAIAVGAVATGLVIGFSVPKQSVEPCDKGCP